MKTPLFNCNSRDDNHLWSRMLSFRIKHSTLFCLHQTLQNISTVCVFLYYEAQKIQKQFEGIYFYDWIGTMKAKSKEETTNTRTKLNSLFSASALLLSVVCCIALFHVELKIQEHHRVISQSATFCDKMEKERWQINKGSNSEGTWQEAQGKVISLSFKLRGENSFT